MERKDFLKALALLPIGGLTMNLNSLKNITDQFGSSQKMPVLFIGHGNPMNAILENEYTKKFNEVGKSFSKPTAILVISAHWETKGTFVTAMEKPRTVHDFGGFPRELNEYQYPAPGSPEVALQTKNAITKTIIELDHTWGLDHGAWTVLTHIFPDANVPVLQLSLDYRKPMQWHYELAKELSSLRDKGVLIVGSGNIVHNLGMVNFSDPAPYDWAVTANEKVKSLIMENNHAELINYTAMGKEMRLAVPSPEHYLPLIYTLAMKGDKENISFFNDKTEYGSLSMTSVKISS
jgi:4,5-DOPA dioxygenase extradiol